MFKIILNEKRQSIRYPLSKKDAVYCVVVRSGAEGKTIALSIADFSQSGFQFAIIPDMMDEFFKGEKLFLKAIAGTRNLTFAEPIELIIRWQNHDITRGVVNIGCEICNITTAAEKQFVDFIKSEVKFRGIRVQNRDTEGTNYVYSARQAATTQIQAKKDVRKVVSILGSPSEDGNTVKILTWVEKELESQGHQITHIDLSSKTIGGCLRCLHCKDNPDEPGCLQEDDAALIIEQLHHCDLAIYASPVYHSGFSSPMETLIDRCHCLYRGSGSGPDHTSFIEGQRQALIATTADSFADSMDQIRKTFQNIVVTHKVHSAGEFFVCNCKNPDGLGEEIEGHAKKFALHLFDEIKAPYSIFIPR
jgi:multimeric flavodoxin WrbA